MLQPKIKLTSEEMKYMAPLCERPFPVSAMVVREPGDSEVLKLVEMK